MFAINNPNNEFELQNLAQPVNVSKQEKETEAALAHLSLLIEEVMEALTPSADATANSKIVHADFHAEASHANNGPSNAQMEAAYSALVGLLAQLQGDIAKYSNTIANDNANVGKALMNEMQAQFNQTIKEIEKVAQEQANASWWSRFTKWIEGIVAAIGVVVATLCGQPELALVIFAFTTLSLSGGMDKITKGIADLISKALVKDGVSKELADKIAKVIADIIVVVATIVVTVATCGAGAAGAATTTVDESIEGGIELADLTVEETVAGTTGAVETIIDESIEGGIELADLTVEQAAVQTTEEAGSSLDKMLNFLKENNPFAKLSKTANFALLTGSMTVGSTGLGNDIMAAGCAKMAEDKEKETLTTAMGVVFGIFTALAGAGASIALAAGPEAESTLNTVLKNIATKLKNLLNAQEFTMSKALKTLMAAQIVGAILDVSGQLATGGIKIQLAQTIGEQGETQALLSELQSLIKMNSEQSSSNSKALASEMRTWGSEIASLSQRLNDLGRAVAQELQA